MFNIDRRMLYVILGIMALWGLASYLQNPSQLLSLVLTLPGVIIAVTFHEYAHALAADKCGDDTPRNQGRLTLNPLAHLDPFGFIMLVFAHVGWGKPVQINPRNFNRKRTMSAQEALVSLAGPLMNFILAIIFTIIYFAIITFAPQFLKTTTGFVIELIISLTITVNIGLGVFNLVPIPPLDGSKILMHFLPYNAKNWFISNQNIFYIIFAVLWITGAISLIISPIINVISSGIYYAVAAIFGLFI